jgi:Ras-related GTP-binding protein A/B
MIGRGEDENPNPDRHERISNIMKSFKHTVAKETHTTAASAGFVMSKIQTLSFNCFLARFTENTYIMVVLPPGEAEFNCGVLNTMMAKESFQRGTGVEG